LIRIVIAKKYKVKKGHEIPKLRQKVRNQEKAIREKTPLNEYKYASKSMYA